MLKDMFKTKPKYITVKSADQPTIRPVTDSSSSQVEKKNIPDGLWVKCDKCSQITYTKDIEANLKVCPKCGFHFRITAAERVKMLADEGSFRELDSDLSTINILDFPVYDTKLKEAKKKTGMKEAVITGEAMIEGSPVVLAIMDFNFMGASMGSVVGEKITRAAERALELGVPFIAFSASGGARMQEGINSLMQMAKTAQVLNRLSEAGCLYVSVLTDPTTGGVFASFASLGDINLAEPGATIGFAGARVIQQTIRQTLPEGFQTSQFLLEHGFVDAIVARKDLRATLAKIVRFHTKGGVKDGE